LRLIHNNIPPTFVCYLEWLNILLEGPNDIPIKKITEGVFDILPKYN